MTTFEGTRPIVTVQQGKLEGINLKTKSAFSYNAFLGIPYAKPPIGNLRFKDPEPANHWDGVRDASTEGNSCAQIDFITSGCTGTEDCLYLNVYVPEDTTVDSELPVMFWIHGGGFLTGSGSKDMYGPDYLVDKNIILVTINYRLGPLGFLCLHTAEVPGNAGLKDQVMALKWVNENIKHFGGNPKNITIFGESAGSISVHLFVMSPITKGLFSKAILQSGTSVNDWCIQTDPESAALKLAIKLGFKNTNNKNKNDLLKYLTTVPIESLIKATRMEVYEIGNEFPFLPVVENQFSPKKAFTTVHPLDLLKLGKFNKVPTLSGFTSNEGVVNQGVVKALKSTGLDMSNVTLDQLIPNFQNFIPKNPKGNPNAATKYVAANKIKEFYFSDENNLIDKYFSFISDYAFIKDTIKSVKTFSAYVPSTYLYQFSYVGSLNLMKILSEYPYNGAAHGDDLGYIFEPSMELLKREANDLDKIVIQRLTEMWTNFAKTGNPTPALSDNIKELWKPVTAKDIMCYNIDAECSIIKNPFQDRLKFWDGVNNLF